MTRPWADEPLFPELDSEPQWGVFGKAGHEPLALAQIVERIDAGPGRELWNGSNERPEVVFVTRPDAKHPVAAVECPELQPSLLRWHERKLRGERKKNAFVFYPLLLLTIALEVGMHTFAVLPAVFAVLTGASYVEAWRLLNRLRRDPQGYLHDKAAQTRYSTWLSLSAPKHRCRTCWMAATWAVIGLVQMVAPESPGHAGEPSYLAAALVKDLVAVEPWRLVTAAMLHGSVFHFLMNAVTLLALGPLLERGAHRHLLAPVWLFGALTGSLLSWAATPTTSIGASGGILAVFTFLFVMGLRRRAQLPPDYASSLARGLVTIAVFGILAWGVIDNAAHLGGAIFGAALGAWVFREHDGPLPLPDSPALRIVGGMSEAAFFLVAAFTAAKLLHLV